MSRDRVGTWAEEGHRATWEFEEGNGTGYRLKITEEECGGRPLD